MLIVNGKPFFRFIPNVFYRDIYYLRPEGIPFGTKGKIEIAFDPKSLDAIYLPSPDGKSAIVCPLTPACNLFSGKTFEEVRDLYALRNQNREKNRTVKLQAEAHFNADVQAITLEAKKIVDEVTVKVEEQSDRAKLLGIRQNRKYEREVERKANSWNLGKSKNPKQ